MHHRLALTCASTGIPHRRGYLLYGAPGSGKTSLIHSIAGELNLDVYILSLTRLGLDDTSLSSTIADLPTQCIVLVEDVDAAFHQGVKRDLADPEKEQDGKEDKHGSKGGSDAPASVGRVTLSGLLNALDGIAAQEGRILFATTNDYDALDPALCRPGRLDLHIEFKLASKYQCREMFRRFYLPSDVDSDGKEKEKKDVAETETADEKDSGYGSRSRTSSVERLNSDSARTTPASGSSADSDESSAVYVGQAHTARAPKLSRRKAAELADAFAAAIPNRAFSMATLQGYLMAYKTRPYDAVSAAPAWVERKLREKGKSRADAARVPVKDKVDDTPAAAVEGVATTAAAGAPVSEAEAAVAGKSSAAVQTEVAL